LQYPIFRLEYPATEITVTFHHPLFRRDDNDFLTVITHISNAHGLFKSGAQQCAQVWLSGIDRFEHMYQ
jgi:hypothetical protein